MATDPEARRQLEINAQKAAVNLAVKGALTADQAERIATNTTFTGAAFNALREPPQGVLDNPPFIFPGPTIKIATTNQTYKPRRGYIRRLNEFYSRMGPDASSITGRRCNFQFQPETIVRTVGAQTTDTQFFFNQDPAQLTVPIPGNSSYTITLMFNREAEVASGKYTNLQGKVSAARGLRITGNDLGALDVNRFINGEYQQDWVCSIGVLADIMVLDNVIGQGISTETIKILNTISNTQAATTAKDSTATAEEQKQAQDVLDKEASKVKFWTGESGVDNPNLGNTAFLVPTPVRIMLSNMMMIEGIITNSSVNFHKFSKHYIPTQCRVDLSVQALYIGFAKNQTMLTQDTPLSLSRGGSGPDGVTVVEKDTIVREATQDGVNNFFSLLGSFIAPSLLTPLKDTIFLNTTGSFLGSFLIYVSDAGEEFYKKYTTENGGEVTWFWEAKIKMFWKTVARGTTANRVTSVVAAPGGSTLDKVVPEADFLIGGELANLTHWGTPDTPLVIESSGGIYKKIRGKGLADEWVVASASGLDTKATWSFTTPTLSTYKRPFTTEQFRIQFELTISAKRYGSDYVSKQKFTTDEIVTVNASMLTKQLKAI